MTRDEALAMRGTRESAQPPADIGPTSSSSRPLAGSSTTERRTALSIADCVRWSQRRTTPQLTEPVVMEVLAGARDARREGDLRRPMARFELTRSDPVTDFDGAARIHRRCRAAGVTPRGLVDCTVASVALAARIPVLAHDRDLALVADVVGLRLDPASLAA